VVALPEEVRRVQLVRHGRSAGRSSKPSPAWGAHLERQPPTARDPGQSTIRRALDDGIGQTIYIEAPAGIAQLERVSPGEGVHCRRQLIQAGHDRALDENRNDDHIRSSKGSFDLAADEVLRVCETGSTVGIAEPNPVAPDQDEHDVATSKLNRKLVNEIDPRRHLEVHKHMVITKPRAQRIAESPCMAGGLFAPIRDEDAWLVHDQTPDFLSCGATRRLPFVSECYPSALRLQETFVSTLARGSRVCSDHKRQLLLHTRAVVCGCL
jgi:hypothetical protein